MERPKTTVFINHSAEMGGAEFALLRLLKAMDRAEWNPVVVFGQEGPAVEAVRNMSVETYVISIGESMVRTRKESLTMGSIFSLARLRDSISFVWKLSQFLKERAADIVHTNSMKAHVLGGLAAKLARVPLVWHLRDTVASSYLPDTAVYLMRALAKRMPSQIITVSRSVADAVGGASSSVRSRVIYDGLEDSAFDHCSTPRATPAWRIGMVGRLCAWKGQHVLIEAAALLQARGLTIDFEILGGPMFDSQKYADGLKKQVESMGLGNRVHFRGFVDNVSQQMRTWDACVHASTSPDPCPNVVIEAMAAGVPVIGSRGGGVPELLDGGRCGDLFQMKNSRELADVIERLLFDRERRVLHSRKARERAQSLFRSERVAAEVQEVWRSLVNNQTWEQRRWRWIESGLDRNQAPVAEHQTGRSSPKPTMA